MGWTLVVWFHPRRPSSPLARYYSLGRMISVTAVALACSFGIAAAKADPCTVIAGKTWAAPSDVRACFTSFEVDEAVKSNIIEVVNKTLAFHTSVNYQISAPEPFTLDVHENLLVDLARISQQDYASDLDLHIDLSRTLKRLDDGHCVYINRCYDSSFLTFVPTPLVLLTDSTGQQAVHIAPEAFDVATAAFGSEVSFWQDALPGKLKGNLQSLSGAKVLKINGQDPFVAVDANAAITGSFQGFGTRQNTYQRASASWNYVFGNFAQQSLPLIDQAILTIQRVNSTNTETVTIPYRSQFAGQNFTDGASFRANNCVAVAGTNGVDLYGDTASPQSVSETALSPDRPIAKFQQQPVKVKASDARAHPMNVLLDVTPVSDVVLPPALVPPGTPLNGSSSVAQFYLLDDGVTGVFALGSFSDTDFDTFLRNMLTGLQGLKSANATRLIVDVASSVQLIGCTASYAHHPPRLDLDPIASSQIVGPKLTSVPQAGLDTKARAGPLAQLISKATAAGADPDDLLLYNPLNWRFANGTNFPADLDWLTPPVTTVINGHPDAFSQSKLHAVLATSCLRWMAEKSSLVLDRPWASRVSGSLTSDIISSITMAKEEGAKTVVVGGKQGVKPEYCGTVGGQSSDFSTMDTEIKVCAVHDSPIASSRPRSHLTSSSSSGSQSTQLKNNTLAPPDFVTNSVQGITWRLGFGIDDTEEPEEWQDHPADVNLPLTADM
ncbi:hypothetical protein EW146_g370 [Bondarzewia mesenterica]|uniref:Uncharacterized protein n=1 Tax=Bondarzewia mesenterica TaxID=1095465 RepID=A0A4S4M7A5_9AGAM|nr:hypothetical protein EW146_g370 [Bondarzewia mesenterica]